MKLKTHFRATRIVCGRAANVHQTDDPKATTCRSCARTKAWRDAWQRKLPLHAAQAGDPSW